MPMRLKTRGIWRLKNCEFPPIRLNFTSESTKHTIFHGLDKPKLVNYCRDNDQYEQYVLQEFQLYRIYRLLTPASHAVRVLHADLRRQRERQAVDDALRVHRRGSRRDGGAHRRQAFSRSRAPTPDDLEPYRGRRSSACSST